MSRLRAVVPSDADRVIPHDLLAERSILGAILIDNGRLIDAVSLGTADFFRDSHQVIFRHIVSVINNGAAADYITVANSIRDAGEGDRINGISEITALTDCVPRTTNVAHYVRIVKQKAALRKIIEASRRLSNAAYDAEASPEELINRAAQDFSLLSADTGQREGLEAEALDDVTAVVAEGQHIATNGIRYRVHDIVPDYGMVGMLIAFAKVGKTSLAYAMGAAVAAGQPFLDRPTEQGRVLVIPAEDPPEYVAFQARNLGYVPEGQMTFYRRPVVLDDRHLSAIAATVTSGNYKLVLASSLQALVRGLTKDENDNAGMVRVIENIKTYARKTGVPWLIDTHAGKGEDQGDDADPTRAMRGASGGAGAADFLLSLRYDSSPFSTRRRFSGKGRFVNIEPIVLDCDVSTSTYMAVGTTKSATGETTLRLICEMNVLDAIPKDAGTIASAIGLSTGSNGRPTAAGRHAVRQALMGRDGVKTSTERRRGQVTTLYSKAAL